MAPSYLWVLLGGASYCSAAVIELKIDLRPTRSGPGMNPGHAACFGRAGGRYACQNFHEAKTGWPRRPVQLVVLGKLASSGSGTHQVTCT
jgi:hypothetical protein